jgi:hypothetical protein
MFLGSKVRLVRKADNLTAISPHNPIGLQGLLRDSFTYFFLLYTTLKVAP